jgi:hypothetical protein
MEIFDSLTGMKKTDSSEDLRVPSPEENPRQHSNWIKC